MRAIRDSRFLVVDREPMLALMARVPEMSDIVVSVFAARRRRLLESGQASLTLIGMDRDRDIRAIAAFAGRNRIPFRSLDLDDGEAGRVVEACGLPRAPAVIFGRDHVVADPTPRKVAQLFGLDLALDAGAIYDVVIFGGGPGGIAAGVYAGAEGLCALVVEDATIGGQAGTSSRIENYMGFPTGISGADLCWRGEVQAMKFGTRFAVPRRATALSRDGDGSFAVTLDDGADAVTVRTNAVIVATGSSTAACPSIGSATSRGRASTMPRPRSRRGSARGPTRWSWAGATRPGKRRCISAARRGRSISWCGATAWPTACRPT
jgi:thioredoxin reductase (NADPH)